MLPPKSDIEHLVSLVARRLIMDSILVSYELFQALRMNPSCKMNICGNQDWYEQIFWLSWMDIFRGSLIKYMFPWEVGILDPNLPLFSILLVSPEWRTDRQHLPIQRHPPGLSSISFHLHHSNGSSHIPTERGRGKVG